MCAATFAGTRGPSAAVAMDAIIAQSGGDSARFAHRDEVGDVPENGAMMELWKQEMTSMDLGQSSGCCGAPKLHEVKLDARNHREARTRGRGTGTSMGEHTYS